jgi:hypothetical protein
VSRRSRPSLLSANPTTMKAPLRIAILECDEPIGKTKEKYGGYGNLFKELLESGARRLADADPEQEAQLDISKWDVVNAEQYPDLDAIDAVLLTGSSTCETYLHE